MTDTELRRLAEGATPGPWRMGFSSHSCVMAGPRHSRTCPDYLANKPCRETVMTWIDSKDVSAVATGAMISLDTGGEYNDPDINTQRYIAAASPDVVLALLDRINALEVERDEIKAVHAELRALFPERPIVNMIDAVREALDRPAISVADASVAVGYLDECGQLSGDDLAAYRRVEETLRAHAAKGGE